MRKMQDDANLAAIAGRSDMTAVAGFGSRCYNSDQRRVPFWIPGLRRPVAARPVPSPAEPGLDAEVLIVGAGPVGLLLANLLGQQGRSVTVIEQRTAPPQRSMSIGITPPSMAILRGLGVDDAFARRGIPIRIARVFEQGACLGEVDFSRLPAEHRFILSLPQAETIALLRDNLRAYPGVTLIDGVQVLHLREDAEAVHVRVQHCRTGASATLSARYVAGCDGHRSTVRRLAGIRTRRRDYRCRFLMADFDDVSGLGAEAHLYFGPRGSVESFPLPAGRRRWIVQQTTAGSDDADIGARVARGVRERVGLDLTASPIHDASAFQPAWAVARHFYRGRVLLCGDAAHMLSPIGGQGMNIGFADAAHLARALDGALAEPGGAARAWRRYAIVRRRAFLIAARRAARGMWLGTRTGRPYSALRRCLITRVLLRPSVRERLAPYFAMLALPRDPVVSALRVGQEAAAR